jgi:hypothetical protein
MPFRHWRFATSPQPLPSTSLQPARLACGARGEQVATVLPAPSGNRSVFFWQAFDHRLFVAYTFLAEILDPFFGKTFVTLDIPDRKKRFSPHRCWKPSPGSPL